MNLTGKLIKKSDSSGVGVIRRRNGEISSVSFNTKHTKQDIPIGAVIVSYKSGLKRIHK